MKNLYHIILFIICCFYIIIIGLNIVSSKYNYIEGLSNDLSSYDFLTRIIPITLETPEDVSLFIDADNYEASYEKTNNEEILNVYSDKTDDDYLYIDWGNKPNCYKIPCEKGGRSCLFNDPNMPQSEQEKILKKYTWACPKPPKSGRPNNKAGDLKKQSKNFSTSNVSDIRAFLNKIKSLI